MYNDQMNASQEAHSFNTPVPTQGRPEKPIRRRVPKACGECRRLKLKCDRVFPCQSCLKRGCEGICPEGSLVSGKGSRYILANTEQLHDKIVLMAERIRELEEALGVISEEHARCLHRANPSSEPSHPLLREDLLLIKNQLELYGLDRSHLAPRSEASYTSDGSDGGEQQFLPSPSDMLFMSSASQYAEQQQQHVGYAGADSNSFYTPPQATNASVPSHQWSTPDPRVSSQNDTVQTFNPYAATAMGVVDDRLQGFYDRNYLASSASLMDANQVQFSVESQQLSYAPSPQDGSAAFPRSRRYPDFMHG